MALSNPFRKKDGATNPVAIVIAVLLALVVALGVSLAVSSSRALGLIAQARTSYDKAQTSLEDSNYEEAYDSARTAVDSISDLTKEFEGPQWSIAAALPVLGDDVRMAREMSAIASKLASEAATPLFDQWDVITRMLADEGSNVVDKTKALLAELSTLGQRIVQAKEVIYACEEQANALPTAHIGQLNDVLADLKKTLSSVGCMLRTLDSLVNDVGSGNLLGGATDLSQLVSQLGNGNLFEGLVNRQ